jgi:HK97 family phage portal protein
VIFQSLKQFFAGVENPNTPLGWEAIQEAIDYRGGGPTDAGITVSQDTAMRFGAVFACVRVVAGTLGSLPLKVYKRRKSGGRDEAVDHPLYPVLHDRPNPQMSSLMWREATEANTLLQGKGFGELQYDGAARVRGIWPLKGSLTSPVRDDKGFRFCTYDTPDGSPREIRAEDMIYLPGLGFDGVTGLSVVSYARQAIALGLAAEKFGAKLFANGVRASGVLMYPGKLNEIGRKNLTDSFDQKHQGADNAHKTILLEEGTKYVQTSIPPDDAQFLETRKYQRSEICGWFGVPPHMIGDLERATFSNIEQQDLEFSKHTMRPRLVRWEQELNWKIFRGTDYFCEFNLDGLLRGDFLSRQMGLEVQRRNGIINRDMWAGLEGMNAVGGAVGDLYIVEANMTTPEALQKLALAPAVNPTGPGTPTDPPQTPDPDEEPPAPQQQQKKKKLAIDKEALRPIFRDCVGRLLAREKRDSAAVQRIFRPVITLMTAMAGTDSQVHAALHGYLNDLAFRAANWKAEDETMITENELTRAFAALEVKK